MVEITRVNYWGLETNLSLGGPTLWGPWKPPRPEWPPSWHCCCGAVCAQWKRRGAAFVIRPGRAEISGSFKVHHRGHPERMWSAHRYMQQGKKEHVTWLPRDSQRLSFAEGQIDAGESLQTTSWIQPKSPRNRYNVYICIYIYYWLYYMSCILYTIYVYIYIYTHIYNMICI